MHPRGTTKHARTNNVTMRGTHLHNKTPQLQMPAAEVEPHRAQTHPTQDKHQTRRTHPSQTTTQSERETHPHPFLHLSPTSPRCQQNADARKNYPALLATPL